MRMVIIRPRAGDKRTKTWFAWIPVKVLVQVGDREYFDVRWLQYVTVRQEFEGYPINKWCNLAFIDPENNEHV